MVWSLSARARAASDAVRGIPYDGAGPWDPALCASSLKPHAARLRELLHRLFPFVRTIGGLDCRENTAHPGQMSIHGSGRSLDVMIPAGTMREANGKLIANYLVQHAQSFGVQLVISNRSVWQANLPPARRFSAYTGPNPHTDHVHVELTLRPGPYFSQPTRAVFGGWRRY